MARGPRVVAELGRPETPDETAARKAEASRVYRTSQNTRNLVAALLVTLAVVAVIIFAVPRGTPPEAERIGDAEGRLAIAPAMSDEWVVNSARLESDGTVRTWTIVYAPDDENERGFLRVAQGFDADESWAARVLSGAAPESTVTIDGVEWDRYELDPSRTANISVALTATAGADTILIYGAAEDAVLEEVAASVSDDVTALREEAE